MFVSESFLIGSAKDGKASIIEKTPEAIDFVEPRENYILSTNHFLGQRLAMTQLNQIHERTSASPYRLKRLAELLARNKENSIAKTARIL